MRIYSSLIRPMLFALSADRAHALGEWLLRRQILWRLTGNYFRVEDPRLHVDMAGLRLRNPVGLAAGFDKDCRMVDALSRLGFGYLTLGTITYKPRSGNPKPRLARLEPKSLVNSMGLPSRGVHRAAEELRTYKSHTTPIIASVAGLTVDEFTECVKIIEPLVDGIELNISSPNEQGLRIFQEPSVLNELLDRINSVRKKALFIKLPYFSEDERDRMLELVDVCMKRQVDGITAINTRRVEESRLATGFGGLSGRSIFNDMLRIVGEIYRVTGGKLAINACGGIFSGADAVKAFEVGASSIQVLTSMIYEGPSIAKKINSELIDLMDSIGVDSIPDLRGAMV